MQNRRLKNLLKSRGYREFSLVNNSYWLDINYTLDYIIDTLPYRVDMKDEHGYLLDENQEFYRTAYDDLEDFYFKESNLNILRKKMCAVILKISYYYKLSYIYISGTGLNNFEDGIITKYYNGFCLKFTPEEVMGNIEEFVDLSLRNIKGVSFTFYYEKDKFFIDYLPSEMHMRLYSLCDEGLDEETVKNVNILSNSEGLFFHDV